MVRLELTLLGGFAARLAPGESIGLPTRKTQALLAFLALPLGRAHSRDKLAALLWGDMGQSEARRNLRTALFSLRRALGATGALVADGDTVILEPANVRVDALELERLVRDGRVEALEEVGRLYRGDLLAGLALREAPFEEWLLAERERLRELAMEGLARLLAGQRAAGASERAIETGLSLLAVDRLQEPVHRTLMRLYAQTGRRGAALRQYQLCVAALDHELRVEPEAETKALYQEILRDRPVVRVDAPSEPAATGPPAVTEPALAETPLVGRERELARFLEALEATWAGIGQTLAVVGDPGVGKTRLVAEVAATTTARGGRVLVGHGYESEQGLPYAPWVDALRTGRIANEREVLEALGPTWRAELHRLLPEVGTPGSPGDGRDALRLFEAVGRLLDELSARAPLLLVIEDVHWADEMTMRLAAFLARRIRSRRILFLLTVREEDLSRVPLFGETGGEWVRAGLLTLLHLATLSRAETALLVRQLARAGTPEPALRALEEEVWRASEGHPFAAVEILRHLGERATLQPGGTPLPRQVKTFVAERLARLSERARRLVDVAAVIGRQFEFNLLHRSADLPPEEAAAGVEELVRRRILEESSGGLAFRHDWIREAAHERLLGPRRVLLHRRIAESLEEQAGPQEESALAIGSHYREAGMWERAAPFLARAGAAASARGAAADAATCYRHALDALTRGPASEDAQKQAFELHLRAAYELYQLGRPEPALEHLHRGEGVARALRDERRLAHLTGGLGHTLAMSGRYREAVETGERAVAAAQVFADPRLEAYARAGLSMSRYALGEYRRSIDDARLALHALEKDPNGTQSLSIGIPPEISARAWMSTSFSRIGDFQDAARWAMEAVAVAEARGDPRGRVVAYHCLGNARHAQGELDSAVALYENALALCEDRPLAWYASRVLAALAFAHALRGDLGRALPLLERALADAQSTAVILDHTRGLNYLAATLSWAGRTEEAGRLAERALDLARSRAERGDEAWAHEALGQVALASDAAADEIALEHFQAALELAERLEMRNLEARCHLGLGQAHQRAGRLAEARAQLARAAERFQELGMRSWRTRADVALAALG